jgi:hypothetical protein
MPPAYLPPGGYTLAFQTSPDAGGVGSLTSLVTVGTTLGYTIYFPYAPFPASLPPPSYTSSAEYIGFYGIFCPAPTWTTTPTPNTALYTATPTATFTTTPAIYWTLANTYVDPTGGRYGQSSVSFNGDMWFIGGENATNYLNDVYYSPDGLFWYAAANPAPFGGRMGHQSVSYNNLMWVIGGYGGYKPAGDVWSSPDGTNWTEATGSAAFPARFRFETLTYDPYSGSGTSGAMWVIGGDISVYTGSNDVWYSQDGANWTETTSNAAFTPRYGHAGVVFNNKMWVIGGMSGSGELNDVWSSSDGANWTEATANAAFPARWGHTCLVYNNLMWIIGGMGPYGTLNDVWSSPDGINWTVETETAIGSPFYLHSSVVLNNKMWILLGNTGTYILNNDWHYP